MRSDGNVSRAIAGTDGNPRVARPQVSSLRRDARTPVERPTRPMPVPRPTPPLPTAAVVIEAPTEEEWQVLDEHLAAAPEPAPIPVLDEHPVVAEIHAAADVDLDAECARVARRSFDRGATVAAIAADLGLRPMGVHNLLAGRSVSAPP